MEHVILVNTEDAQIGTMEKIQAHTTGELHRALSVLVFNSKGEMLLQKRAQGKYHSGGLWTNACCSHPKPNEETADATKRRLKEEMGIDADPVFLYKFIYKTALDNGLTEHEYDHVFTCTSDKPPIIDKTEVEDYKYMDMKSLHEDIVANPQSYTYWFKLIIDQLKSQMKEIIK